MDETTEERLAVARRAAAAASEVAAERFRSDLAVETKSGETDVVTEADRTAQRRAREVIAETYPDEPLVGEENDADGAIPEEGPAWIVDPIDGTNNYVRGVGAWTSAVAAVVDADPVGAAITAPVLSDAFLADDRATRNDEPISVSDRSDPATCAVCPTLWWPPERRDECGAVLGAIVERFGDLRRYGSTQLELALVACGALDAAITTVRAHPWDTVAGVHLIRQAGGRVTDLDGERWRHDSTGLVATNGAIHDEALAAARAAIDQ